MSDDLTLATGSTSLASRSGLGLGLRGKGTTRNPVGHQAAMWKAVAVGQRGCNYRGRGFGDAGAE